jgi:quinol monooxygenase YgiN
MKATGTVAAIRAEKGNLRYADFSPVDDPATILLIDSWENQEAFGRHHASLMMKKITELREEYDLHMKVERYVSDESMPDLDHKFIRR